MASVKFCCRSRTGTQVSNVIRLLRLQDIEEMKRQYLLARFFLRSIIEKKRQIYESDGEGLSEDEAGKPILLLSYRFHASK